MRGSMSRNVFPAALFCVLASLPATGAETDQTGRNRPAWSQVIVVNGNTVIRNGRVQTKTIRRHTAAANPIHIPKVAPAPKDAPVVKGDAGSCITLVRDTSGLNRSPSYRARNSCARRIRLWVFDTDEKQWLDSIIVEQREDATADDHDGIDVGANQVVAACTMQGDTNPPGCFPKISNGLYAIVSDKVILR